MTWLQALILGVVEGLTEFLPVSSTGHLLLAQRLLGISKDSAADAYVIVIQLGAILAVLGLYRARIFQMLKGLAGRDSKGLRISLNVIIAFIPAAIVGLLLDDTIEAYLYGLWPVTAAWFVGGLAILAVIYWQWRNQAKPEAVIADRSGAIIERGFLETMNWKMALGVGLIQCLSMWPGTSRSLVTIVGGLLVGLELAAAVEFSFILGVATLGAASFYKIWEDGPAIVHTYDKMALLIGVVAACLSAAITVKWMVSYLRRRSLAVFGYYRIALAIVVGLLLLSQVVTNP